MHRIILLVDMDSFYASVEENRNPEIRGKAIVTCMFSGRSKDSGAVSAANYRARELGIRSGMPIRNAKGLAKGKDAVFLPSDREYYKEVSGRVMEILRNHADEVKEGVSGRLRSMFEQVSVDEAYLDISKRAKGDWEKAVKTAESLKKEVKERENLTCSVGIGPNKLVAKMASKKQKPDGLTLVKDSEVRKFMESFPLDKMHGIGGRTVEELAGLGIKTVKELAGSDRENLEERLGPKRGRILWERARGMDGSPVEEREAKQISRMATLKKDSDKPDEIMEKIGEMSQDLEEELKQARLNYKTISIILIDTRLQMQTRGRTTIESSSLRKNLDIARDLLERYLEENPETKLRRVGIRVSGLSHRNPKLEASRSQRTLGDFPKA
jgi:DNA polymerase IV (DinB-like DNA polymerase)